MSGQVGLVLFLEFDDPTHFGHLYAAIAHTIDAAEGVQASAWACIDEVLEELRQLQDSVRRR